MTFLITGEAQTPTLILEFGHVICNFCDSRVPEEGDCEVGDLNNECDDWRRFPYRDGPYDVCPDCLPQLTSRVD